MNLPEKITKFFPAIDTVIFPFIALMTAKEIFHSCSKIFSDMKSNISKREIAYSAVLLILISPVFARIFWYAIHSMEIAQAIHNQFYGIRKVVKKCYDD